MVRLMLVLAPVMCILAGIGVSATLGTYMKNLDPLFPSKKSEGATSKKATKKSSGELNYPMKNEVMLLLLYYILHCILLNIVCAIKSLLFS